MPESFVGNNLDPSGNRRARLTLARRKLRSISVKRRAYLPFIVLLGALFCLAQAGFAQGVQIEKADHQQSPAAAAAPQKPKASPPPTPAEALYEYLQKYHIEVAKDQSPSHLVWTDRVMIEITDGLPPEPLAGLLSTAPTNNGQFAKFVHDTFETQTKSWRAGKRNPKPAKAGTDELIGDNGTDHCYINPVYLSYVLARYPKANILIKGPTDPALFTVNGQLRAVISPWTQLPDGTPLQ